MAREWRNEEYFAWIAEQVAAAPLLTDEQRIQLAVLLSPPEPARDARAGWGKHKGAGTARYPFRVRRLGVRRRIRKPREGDE